MNNLINNIKDSELFRNIDLTEIDKLISVVNYKQLNLQKNQSAFDTYSDPNYIGLVLNGSINIEKLLPSGKSVFMYSKKRGDIFGEVAVFSEMEQYPCNAVSVDNSTLLLFSKSEFFKLLTLSPNVLKNFLKLVCNKAFMLNSRVGTLSFTSVKQKIAQSLLYDFAIENNSLVQLPFNKKVWADSLNISRSSLYRELDLLCNDLIISLDKSNAISILDINRLKMITLN